MPSRGIVLRKNNPYSTYYLLDEHNGILLSTIAREGICTGACIHYTIQQKLNWNTATGVELIAMPCTQTLNDLMFFHNALEICHACMPVSSISPGVFEHISYFYDEMAFNTISTDFLKKLFLCKLLILLGFYPHDTKFNNKFFYKLAIRPFDYCITALPTEADQPDLDDWLASCLAIAINNRELNTGHIKNIE